MRHKHSETFPAAWNIRTEFFRAPASVPATRLPSTPTWQYRQVPSTIKAAAAVVAVAVAVVAVTVAATGLIPRRNLDLFARS